MTRSLIFSTVLLLLTAAGCRGGDLVYCEGGTLKSCVCPDGTPSFKQCNDWEYGYGECDCPSEGEDSIQPTFDTVGGGDASTPDTTADVTTTDTAGVDATPPPVDTYQGPTHAISTGADPAVGSTCEANCADKGLTCTDECEDIGVGTAIYGMLFDHYEHLTDCGQEVATSWEDDEGTTHQIDSWSCCCLAPVAEHVDGDVDNLASCDDVCAEAGHSSCFEYESWTGAGTGGVYMDYVREETGSHSYLTDTCDHVPEASVNYAQAWRDLESYQCACLP